MEKKTINFKELEVYKDITRTDTIQADIRKGFANMLYKGGDGIVAHSLALRIYESDGPIEVSPDEAAMILSEAKAKCTPVVIDGIKKQLEP